MEYHSTLTVQTMHAGQLLKLLEVEQREGEKDRAEFTAEQKENTITIKVNAKDSTALRAVLVSITKILTVFEKINEMDAK